MATLKCTECGETFKAYFVKGYAIHVSPMGVEAGPTGPLGYNLVVWPFTRRIYTKCPNCDKFAWVKVLRPKIFGKRNQKTRERG